MNKKTMPTGRQAKTKGFIKLTILVFGLIVSGYAIGGISHAKAFDSKPIAQERHAHPSTFRGWIKIYMASAPINVTFENSKWQANRNEIRSWITDNSGVISVDPTNFVNQISGQVNIPVTSDHDGRNVDTNNLTSQIKEALTTGQPNSTIALVTSVIPRINPHAQAGRYEGRYIDINLSEQTLYAFEGSTLVNQFLVSTGVQSHPSPVGEFSVYNKTSSQLMDGPGYYLPNVPWISWFSGDYSIHGTYWHSNFGTPMSHGCINASIADAEWIFNWDDVGTPVYIHD